MIVVADTSPINYLIQLGQIDLLSALYDRVLIPSQVLQELQRGKAPQAVRSWASALPAWCEICSPTSAPDPRLDELDDGERDVIQFALEMGLDTLLMDDYAGRVEAERRHLTVVGTVALLEKAGRRGLIHFRSALTQLEQTNFRLSPQLRDEFLRRNP